MALQHRPEWLVLADGGAAIQLPDQLPRLPIRVVADGATFARHLTAGRTRLAVVCSPPGARVEIELLIRERRSRPGLRAVLINDHGAVDERLRVLAEGLDDALDVTLDPAELAGRLRHLDERRATEDAATVVALSERLELDTAAHKLRRDGQPVHLRPKEFRLLRALVARPGRVLTRRQLLDEVWGPEHHGDPRTVDVHVRWLREKVEPDPEHPVHIITVRGVGYRLDAGARR